MDSVSASGSANRRCARLMWLMAPPNWNRQSTALTTGGRNHPTTTIQALAFRAAENLVQAAKAGDV